MTSSSDLAHAFRSLIRRQRHYSLVPYRFLQTADPKKTHPAVLAQAHHRSASLQLRIADAITGFAGSMWFVYLHIVLFAGWMLLVEPSPWPTLTLIVSLEAIFLSTFVMIGQNRQAAFQQAKADRDYEAQEKLLIENTDLTRLIHRFSAEIRAQVLAEVAPAPRPDESAHEQTASTVQTPAPTARPDAASERLDGQ